MRILLMSKIFVHSGVASHIMDLSKNLIERGHSVWIMSSNNLNTEFCERNGLVYVPMDFSMHPLHFAKNIFKIKRFIEANGIDIVHCHHRTCSFYMKAISSIMKIPFVWTNHLNNIPSDIIHRKTTFYGQQAICVSSDLKDFCVDKLKIPASKISVVYNGISPQRYKYDEKYVSEFKQKYNLGKKKVIGLLARMDPIKGHIHLINAVSNIQRNKINDCVIVLYGGG